MEDDILYYGGNGCTQKNSKAGKAKMTILFMGLNCALLYVYMIYTSIYGFFLPIDILILIIFSDILKVFLKYNNFM